MPVCSSLQIIVMSMFVAVGNAEIFSLQKCKNRSFENAAKHTSDRQFGVQEETRQLAPRKHEQRKPLAESINMVCSSRRMSLTAAAGD